jgi:hypothetical protein
MSTLSQFMGGGVKSIQTARVSANFNTGSGEDLKYYDVAISSVNTAKSIILLYGAGTGGTTVLPRLISSTALRFSAVNVNETSLIVRFQVVEYY